MRRGFLSICGCLVVRNMDDQTSFFFRIWWGFDKACCPRPGSISHSHPHPALQPEQFKSVGMMLSGHKTMDNMAPKDPRLHHQVRGGGSAPALLGERRGRGLPLLLLLLLLLYVCASGTGGSDGRG